jgi:hypothetical protein
MRAEQPGVDFEASSKVHDQSNDEEDDTAPIDLLTTGAIPRIRWLCDAVTFVTKK